MSTVDIIIMVVVFSFVGYRLYTRYNKNQPQSKENSGSKSFGSGDADEYEPYR